MHLFKDVGARVLKLLKQQWSKVQTINNIGMNGLFKYNINVHKNMDQSICDYTRISFKKILRQC